MKPMARHGQMMDPEPEPSMESPADAQPGMSDEPRESMPGESAPMAEPEGATVTVMFLPSGQVKLTLNEETLDVPLEEALKLLVALAREQRPESMESAEEEAGMQGGYQEVMGPPDDMKTMNPRS